MNLPVGNLTLSRAVKGLLAATALLELLRILLVLSTVCPSRNCSIPTLTPMDWSHCRRIDQLPQRVFVRLVEVALASTSHLLN